MPLLTTVWQCHHRLWLVAQTASAMGGTGFDQSVEQNLKQLQADPGVQQENVKIWIQLQVYATWGSWHWKRWEFRKLPEILLFLSLSTGWLLAKPEKIPKIQTIPMPDCWWTIPMPDCWWTITMPELMEKSCASVGGQTPCLSWWRRPVPQLVDTHHAWVDWEVLCLSWWTNPMPELMEKSCASVGGQTPCLSWWRSPVPQLVETKNCVG